MEMDRDILKYFYICEKMTLKEIFDMTTERKISEKDFKWITGYNYQGIKKSRDW